MTRRAFHFSYDEPVHQSDVQTIVDAAREFPGMKVFTHNKGWTVETQCFVIASDAQDARDTYVREYKYPPEEASEILPEHFVNFT